MSATPPPAAPAPTTLADLPPGGSAEVLALTGPENLRPALMELGLIPGVEVELVRRAPLGCPLEVALRGSRFAIRRDAAAHVEVRIRG